MGSYTVSCVAKMENPDLNVKTSNVDSQAVGSLCSLSLPSEPPDIRNWFSSYAYESPVLGTSDNFEQSVCIENDCKKDGCGGVQRIGEKKKLGNFTSNGYREYTSQILDSSHSLSLPSEPPDVGNWFSSYMYESPVLDTGFRDSHLNERECEEDGYLNEDSNIEKEILLGKFRRNRKRGEVIVCKKMNSTGFVKCNNSFQDNKPENQTICKIVDSSSSLSQPSEPPDIGNLFSSYVYESPVLDTALQDSQYKERECMKDEFVIGKSSREEDRLGKFRTNRSIDEVCEKNNSNGLINCNNSFQDVKLENQSLSQDNDRVRENKNPSAHFDLHFERSCEKGKNLGGSPSNNVKQSSVEEEVSDLLTNNKSSGNNDGSSPKGFIQMKETKRNSFLTKDQPDIFNLGESESHFDSIRGNVNPTAKSNPVRTDKENEVQEHGFVSIRKKRCAKANVENSLKIPLEAPSNGDRREAFVKRKVLADTSNLQYSDVHTVTGKWRCPQKRKPNLGPPMKQLRLEQWVHRI